MLESKNQPKDLTDRGKQRHLNSVFKYSEGKTFDSLAGFIIPKLENKHWTLLVLDRHNHQWILMDSMFSMERFANIIETANAAAKSLMRYFTRNKMVPEIGYNWDLK